MLRRLLRPLTNSHIVLSVVRWFDRSVAPDELEARSGTGVDWVRIVPLLVLHLACLGMIWVGWSWTAVGVAIGLYLVRMWAITGVYHRYFSHRSYKMSRFWQFVLAALGSSAVQGGPLWWSAHHRYHHQHADTTEDIHSPVQQGFLYSQLTWIVVADNYATRTDRVRDWFKFPELRFLDRFDTLVPWLLLAALFVVGEVLRVHAPGLGTSGLQLAVWGFAISSVVLLHATSTINSLDHMIGSRRYDTPDNSRNNWLLAILTLGEGWHNNHHRYSVSARQGFRWWEVDPTYYSLVVLSWLGIVRDLRPVPQRVVDAGRRQQPPAAVGDEEIQ